MDLREIPGFPGYKITRAGKIWSEPKYTGQGHRGKWLKQRKVTGGYIQVIILRNNKRTPCQVHRLVLETFVGLCPKGMVCRHLNGNPADNRLVNICWGTPSENVQDSIRHGTYSNGRSGVYGEDNPTSKLSNRDRRAIIYQYSTGLFSQGELAKLYSVCQQTVGHLVNGKAWPFVNIVRTMKALKIPRGQYV